MYKNLKQYKPVSVIYMYTKNSCISMDIGMNLRKRLLMPKDPTVTIYLSCFNLKKQGLFSLKFLTGIFVTQCLII